MGFERAGCMCFKAEGAGGAVKCCMQVIMCVLVL
jgi:hypothetical protein